MNNQITPSDLALFAKGRQALEEGQAILLFAQKHIGQTYKITATDLVDMETGIITRVVPE